MPNYNVNQVRMNLFATLKMLTDFRTIALNSKIRNKNTMTSRNILNVVATLFRLFRFCHFLVAGGVCGHVQIITNGPDKLILLMLE